MQKSILLIDPNPEVYTNHQHYLKKDKINLQYSKSLRHALWLVQENLPDLILSEIYFNGFIEYEHLFLLRQVKDIPIIVQSSQLPDNYADNCLIRGAQAYFSKPLDWPKYLQTIEKCLQTDFQLQTNPSEY